MNLRLTYTLLFALPGFFLAGLAALFLFGAGAGFLWLFVYGDSPWPESTQTTLPLFFFLTFLALWLAAIIAGYRTGRRREARGGFRRSHLWLSLALTLLPLGVIALHASTRGTAAPKTDSMICNEFCLERGYNGSGTSPRNQTDRTCTCYDSQGRDALVLPIDELLRLR